MKSSQTLFEECQKLIDYQFKDLSLLKKALTHSSAADTPSDSNERLEFLGDSVLGLCVSELIYRKFPDFQEGALTKIRSMVVCRQSCTNIAKAINMGNFLLCSSGLSAVPDSLLGNVMESLVGAIYMDSGIVAARKFVKKFFFDELRKYSDENAAEDCKSRLQCLTQQNQLSQPVYSLLKVSGPEHMKKFQICVQIGTTFFPPAWGNSKKNAEQAAALNALNSLKPSETTKNSTEKAECPSLKTASSSSNADKIDCKTLSSKTEQKIVKDSDENSEKKSEKKCKTTSNESKKQSSVKKKKKAK